MILSQFQTVGRDLFTKGLVSSHSGNLSIRLGERIIITRRSSRLGCLEEHDLIETGLSKNDRNTPLASVELAVHRAIYQQTSALAIVHAPPPPRRRPFADRDRDCAHRYRRGVYHGAGSGPGREDEGQTRGAGG